MQKRVDGCISFVYNKELQKLSKKTSRNEILSVSAYIHKAKVEGPTKMNVLFLVFFMPKSRKKYFLLRKINICHLFVTKIG